MLKGIFSILDLGASGLSSQRKQLNAVAQNIANVETTRTEDGTPYKRKRVVFSEDSQKATFVDMFKSNIKRLTRTHAKHQENDTIRSGHDGKIPFVDGEEIEVEPESFKMVHDPSHPDADENGNVMLPDINVISEMVDMLAATRAYEANISVINSAKDMAKDALDI